MNKSHLRLMQLEAAARIFVRAEDEGSVVVSSMASEELRIAAMTFVMSVDEENKAKDAEEARSKKNDAPTKKPRNPRQKKAHATPPLVPELDTTSAGAGSAEGMFT